MKQELLDWAQKYVTQFNELSELYKCSYYTQSPLTEINSDIDLMIIGINPKGSIESGISNKNDIEFLRGNPFWSQRFNADGSIHKDWAKFFGGARFFLGYRGNKSPDPIDDDNKTVWTNLSPFVSPKGSSDLRKELLKSGIESTIELISILKPKKILFLGCGAFEKIKKHSNSRIEYYKVFDNKNLFIGRINDIPAITVNHPSGQWAVSNKFTSVFIFLHSLCEDGKSPLKDVKQRMMNELKLWQTRINID